MNDGFDEMKRGRKVKGRERLEKPPFSASVTL